MSDNDSATFKRVLDEELELLEVLRDSGETLKGKTVYKKAENSALAGLAFSGGGIRSATVNLGIIQSLAKSRLLHKFDYLSTVSGGGYIGGWLSALLHREIARKKEREKKKTVGTENNEASERAKKKEPEKIRVAERDVRKLEKRLRPHPKEGKDEEDRKNSGFSPMEHKAVRYLRRYSNYLAPQLGFTGDVLALISIVLRNFVLIQLSLIAGVASAILLAHLIVSLTPYFGLSLAEIGSRIPYISSLLPENASPSTGHSIFDWPIIVGTAALIVAVLNAGRLMGWAAPDKNQDEDDGEKKSDNQDEDEHTLERSNHGVKSWIILPLVIATWCFAGYVFTNDGLIETGDNRGAQIGLWCLAMAIGYGMAWAVGNQWRKRANPGAARVITDSHRDDTTPPQRIQFYVTIFCGGILGWLLHKSASILQEVSQSAFVDIWFVVAFGPPVVLLILSFVVTLHIGGVRRDFSHHDREFLARLGGYVLSVAAAWTVVFCFALYSTPLVMWLAGGAAAAVFGWVITSVSGTLLAGGASTGDNSDSNWREWVVAVVPWVFLAGLGVLVTYATQLLLLRFVLDLDAPDLAFKEFTPALRSYLGEIENLGLLPALGSFLVMVAVFWLISRRLDLNLFSLHSMYCNRLARAYLGASRGNDRRPNPFTGFDPKDDIHFSDLEKQRPIHIVNTAINATGGDDLAWQTRRAASFSLTPTWAGYSARTGHDGQIGQYRPTKHYAGGRQLATWVAVSGAAASPNMGFHTSPAVAGLLTAFNARLGRWCGNPDAKQDINVWQNVSPRYATTAMLKEFTGSANLSADWINLTDGGHFENLGVYELIRRRCRLIVAIDAGCDKEHEFTDLANMVRKCWVDFGVNVRFESMKPLLFKENSRNTTAHFVLGRIDYSPESAKKEDKSPYGIIVYIKSSLTGDEWPDIRQYANAHEDFPHETTADQFFSEDQFEAYRHLGYKMMSHTTDDLGEILDEEMVDEDKEGKRDKEGKLKVKKFTVTQIAENLISHLKIDETESATTLGNRAGNGDSQKAKKELPTS